MPENKKLPTLHDMSNALRDDGKTDLADAILEGEKRLIEKSTSPQPDSKYISQSLDI